MHLRIAHVDAVELQRRPARGKGPRRGSVGMHEHLVEAGAALEHRMGAAAPVVEVAGHEQRILGRCDAHAEDGDQVLVTELRSWRTTLAKERDVPAYVVMSDATLKAVALKAPTSARDLLKVPGIGPAKVEQFGEDILGIVKNYS